MRSKVRFSVYFFLAMLIVLPGLNVGMVGAESTSHILTPVSYTTRSGSTSITSVSALYVIEQTGTANDPGAYVIFKTPQVNYIGQQNFRLPTGVNRDGVGTMKLQVNFKGPLFAAQKWSWHLYNFQTGVWKLVGTNRDVKSATEWTLLDFPVTDPASFISAKGQIRVMLRSSNSTANAKVDYEAIRIQSVSSVPPTPTPIPTQPAAAFYVSPQGNDGNPGTQAQPWKTIQKAANNVTPGSLVIVQAGDYPERVTLNRSGSAGTPITFEAQGRVVMRGFTITADYVKVRGFEITNTPDDSRNGMGIWVQGSGCVLENNYIHYATRGGILLFAEPGFESQTSNCIVRNNRLYRNSQYGIDVRGRNHLIEGNEVWGTIQHHPGWSNRPSWVDADGMRFFGSGHVFRGNYIHDILYAAAENAGPHIDCFQTFQALPYQEAASNIIFERNRCDNAQSQSSLEVGKGFMLQNASSITIRNNLIHAYVGIKADHYSNNLTILNNTFTSNVNLTTSHNPSGVSLTDVPSAVIKNNIFFNLPGHIVYLTRSTVTAGRNIAYRNDGKSLWNSSTYSHTNDLWGVNPRFVSATDFHLAAGSPAIDGGWSVSVANDFDGNPRPQGAGYDIGAFER